MSSTRGPSTRAGAEISPPPIPARSPLRSPAARASATSSPFLVDGQFDLFEAILEPGAVYELRWPSAPDGAPPVIHATQGIAPRGAYR